MPAAQPDCWANTGAVPAAVNTARAYGDGNIFVGGKKLLHVNSPLMIVARTSGPIDSSLFAPA